MKPAFAFCFFLGTFVSPEAIRAQATNLIQACKTKQGQIRLFSSPANYARSETYAAWNITGPHGVQGAPGADGFKLSVFDSSRVARQAGAYWVLFEVFPFGMKQFSVPFGQVGEIRRYYETVDCSGQPLVEVRGMLREGQTSGGKVYFGADPVQPRIFRSTRNAPISSPGRCRRVSVSWRVGNEWFCRSD